MAVFNWRVEVGSSGNSDFSVFASKFGDGYSQISPNGLNNETQRWTARVSGKSKRILPILAFLREHGGAPFEWRAPNTSGLGWYSCKRFSQFDEGGDYWTITMEFEQAYPA